MNEERPPETREKASRKPFWRDLTIGGMMAIIAALSLLFAAVTYQIQMRRTVRDSARRSACLNNLKQIGLALATYQQNDDVYPMGSLPNPDLPVDRQLGWMYALIPYLDLHGSITGGPSPLPWDDEAFRPLNYPSPGQVRCPSIPNPTTPGGPIPAVYIGIAGLGVDAPGLPKSDPRAGFFGNNRTITPRDISDGSSNTMAVAESSLAAGPWFAGGRHTVRGLDPAKQPYLGPGRQFGGIHPSGTNVLMADGSVRTIKESIAPKVFEALSTIAGGEKVSAPWDK